MRLPIAQVYHGKWQELLTGRGRPVFRAVIYSPPYNIGVPYDTYKDKVSWDRWLGEAQLLGAMLQRYCMAGASLWVNLGQSRECPEMPGLYLAEMRKAGWIVQNEIAWIKAATSLDDAGQEFNWGNHRPLQHEGLLWKGWERVIHLVRSEDYPVKLNREALGVPFSDKSNIRRFGHARDLRCRGNVCEIPYVVNQSKDHPAQFPVEVPLRCLALMDGTFSEPIPHVLDPYGGVGNTMMAAAFHGWDVTQCEISSAYCAKAVERWNKLWEKT